MYLMAFAIFPISEHSGGMWHKYIYKWFPGSSTGWSRGIADVIHGYTVCISRGQAGEVNQDGFSG